MDQAGLCNARQGGLLQLRMINMMINFIGWYEHLKSESIRFTLFSNFLTES